jgi:hypothetical protein
VDFSEEEEMNQVAKDLLVKLREKQQAEIDEQERPAREAKAWAQQRAGILLHEVDQTSLDQPIVLLIQAQRNLGEDERLKLVALGEILGINVLRMVSSVEDRTDREVIGWKTLLKPRDLLEALEAVVQ